MLYYKRQYYLQKIDFRIKKKTRTPQKKPQPHTLKHSLHSDRDSDMIQSYQ